MLVTTKIGVGLLALGALYFYLEGVGSEQAAVVLTLAGGFYMLISAVVLR
ncbi:MAG: hypothetical protein H6883_12535 [Rhodobiaceae bacterium]|nr:hypothetical protein [Rhodobiaceae bacterium]MCC0056951.1 hypothetical protein [Rhodobiaceae bacterium]